MIKGGVFIIGLPPLYSYIRLGTDPFSRYCDLIGTISPDYNDVFRYEGRNPRVSVCHIGSKHDLK